MVVVGIVKTIKLIRQKGHKSVVGSCGVDALRVEFRALLINWFVLPPGFKLNTMPAL